MRLPGRWLVRLRCTEMKKSFIPGDTVYDVHGREGSYIGSSATGHVVEPTYECEDGPPHYGDVQTWREVFTKPPVEKLHADVAAIESQLTAAKTSLARVREEQRLAESEIAAAKKRIASNPQLHDLDLWLQGKVTHIVSLDYCTLSIATVEVTLTSADRERSLRLLNLRVDPKAQQFWVSYAGYNDGSGSQTRCLLATSLEHAQQRAAEYVAQEVRSKPNDNHAGLAASAIRHGVAVSDKLRQAVIEREAASKAEKLKQAQDNFQRAQKALIDAGGAL